MAITLVCINGAVWALTRSLPSALIFLSIAASSWLLSARRADIWNGIGIYIIAICAVVWLNPELAAASLMSHRIVSEAATRGLPDVLRFLSFAGSILGLIAARRIVVWIALGIYRWAPLRVLTGYLGRVLRPPAIWLSDLWLRVATSLRCAWLRLSAVLLYLWLRVSSVLRYLWLVFATALRYASLGLSAPYRLVCLAFSTMLGYALLLISTILRYLGLGLSTVLRFASLSVSTVLRCLWLVFAGTLRLLWLGISTLLCDAWLGGSTILRYVWLCVCTVFAYLSLVVSTILRYLCFGVSTALRHAWLSASTVLRYAWLGPSTVLRYGWLVVSTVLHCLWRVVSAVLRYVWLRVSTALGLLWLGLSTLLHYVRQGGSAALSCLWLMISTALGYARHGVSSTLHYVWLDVSAIIGYAWLSVSTALSNAWLGISAILRHLGLGSSAVLSYLWLGLSTILRCLWLGIYPVFRYLWLLFSTVLSLLWLSAATILCYLRLVLFTVLRYAWLGLSTILRYLWLVSATALHYLWLGISTILRCTWLGFSTILQCLWLGISSLLRHTCLGLSTILGPLGLAVAVGLRYLWLGLSTIALVLGWMTSGLRQGVSATLPGAKRSLTFPARTLRTACSTARDVWSMLVWIAKKRKGVPAMSEFNLTRERLFSLIATLWVFGILAFLGVATFRPAPPEPTVAVVHWANGHVMRPMLLPEMAKQFNQAGHRTRSGKRIEIQVFRYGSWEQVADLVSRVAPGVPIEARFPDPTIVTPSADHWLVSGNQAAGRPLVDLNKTKSIARTWIGIVTYRDMAECLGWPNKEIGYADIIALRNDPLGWARYPCAKAEWGQRPLVAYTDPTTSSTGRSVLFSLYAIAAGKSPEQLTAADVADLRVVDYVRQFQQLVDHYMIGTIPLNTKVYQGPRYGHFFLMPEDNLIHLYEGTEFAIIDGVQVQAPPIARPMVMIYPKEGSALHNHSTSLVEAPWVSAEQAEAAERWVDFLREDERQRAFMAAGFRPATGLPPADPISGRYGLDPAKPTVTLNPDRIDQAAAAAITGSWDEVKKPAIVTFVVDTSGSMLDTKLQQAKDGFIRALDAMAKNNQVGLVTFADAVNTRVPVAPLAANRFKLADTVQTMRAGGQTALYDAIKAGIELTDAAPGEGEAIRGVVVLTDGRANRGQTKLQDLIRMTSSNEVDIVGFGGMESDATALEAGGRQVEKKNVIGKALAMKTRHPIQIFFIGIGKDADKEIGRMLAEATGAEFQASAEKDLANVLAEFSKYF